MDFKISMGAFKACVTDRKRLPIMSVSKVVQDYLWAEVNKHKTDDRGLLNGQGPISFLFLLFEMKTVDFAIISY